MDLIISLAILALFAVLIVMVLGITTFASGKDDANDMVANNKLMRLRVEIQAVAIGLVLLGLIAVRFWHF